MPVKTAKWHRGGTWINTAVERLLKEAGTHKLGTYIDGRNLVVSEWVALRPKLEDSDRQTDY